MTRDLNKGVNLTAHKNLMKTATDVT